MDEDSDGFGDNDRSITECECPSDYVVIGGDCDDHDETVHPEAEEIVDDGIDNDCDGIDQQGPIDTGASGDTSVPVLDSGRLDEQDTSTWDSLRMTTLAETLKIRIALVQ